MEKSGGVLEIGLSEQYIEKEMKIEKAKVDRGHYLELSVQDTGSGIKNDILDKIFNPFFTTKKSNNSTGLGLSIAYGIVKDHEGYIFVESQAGKGTNFNIYLPQLSVS